MRQAIVNGEPAKTVRAIDVGPGVDDGGDVGHAAEELQVIATKQEFGEVLPVSGDGLPFEGHVEVGRHLVAAL